MTVPLICVFALFGYGLIIGYAMHLIEDMLTKDGIMLNYPEKDRTSIPIFRTGSIMERLVANIIAVIGLLITLH